MNVTSLNIRRIDSRREDIRAAMAELRAGSARRATSSARPAGSGRSRSLASRFRPSRSSSGSAATCKRRAWRPCSIIRPGSTRPSLRPRRFACPQAELAAGPCRGRSAIARSGSPCSREHPRVSAGDSAPRRAGGAAGRISGAAVSAVGSGGDLRAGRGRRLSLDRVDDGRARPSGRRRSNWPWSPRRRSSARTTPTCWPPATSLASPRSIAWAAPRPSPRWPTAWRAFRGSTRSSGPATCSWRWPRNTSLARWISTRSPDPAKWW